MLPQETDEFEYHYSAHEKPNIQNDVVTLNHKMAGDPLIKVAIAHALAQSTKLCIYEQRVIQLAEETKILPEILAEEASDRTTACRRGSGALEPAQQRRQPSAVSACTVLAVSSGQAGA